MGAIARSRDAATDRELVAAVRSDDDAAFEELYRRYSRRVSGYVQRKVGDHGRAEDITQEAFVSALRRMRQTDAEIAFKPWIFEIAKNAAIDHFRRASRAEEVSIHPSDGDDGGLHAGDHLRLVGGGPGPDAALDHKERLDHLRGALDELSESHSRILVMRELEGLSYREIGERMALTRPAVESTLFRARRRLGQEYAELDTGARCLAMTAALARLAEGFESARDRRRLARHLRRCTSCRRHARDLGVAVDAAPARSRVAALLPLPALLRRRRGGGDAATSASGQAPAAGVQHAAGGLAPALAPAAAETTTAAWGKAAAIVAAVALAGGGAAVTERVASQRDAADGAASHSPNRGDRDPAGTGRRAADGATDGPVFLSPRGTEELGAPALDGPAKAGGGTTSRGGDSGTRDGIRSGGDRGSSRGGEGPERGSSGGGPALPGGAVPGSGGSGGGGLTDGVRVPSSSEGGSGDGGGPQVPNVTVPVTTTSPSVPPPPSAPPPPPVSAPAPVSVPPVRVEAPPAPELPTASTDGVALPAG